MVFEPHLPAAGQTDSSIPPSLWPGVGLAGLLVVLNGLVWTGWPLHLFAVGILGLFSLGCLGLCLWRKPTGRGVQAVGIALVCVWLALADASGRLLPSVFVSAHPDAWSYDAVAGYLDDFGRTRTDGMPLVDQFATHLRETRLSSSCLLALGKAALGPGHLFATHTLFYATLLFVTFFSMSALGACLGLPRRWALAAGGVSVLFGWGTNAIVIGNYDNLCFIALFPAAVALLLNLAANPGPRPALLLALIVAALFYTYPEGAALNGPVILLLLASLFRHAPSFKRLAGSLLLATTTAAILSLPYLPIFFRFLANQIGTTSGGDARPGSGSFPGLLDHRLVPAAFALGSEYPRAGAGALSHAIGWGLLGLLALGVVHVYRRHAWIAPAGATVLMLLLWQAGFARYDYGAYKVLFCHAWLLLPVLVAGGDCLFTRWPRIPIVLLLGGLVAAAGLEKWRHRPARVWPQTADLAALGELPGIAAITQDTPVFLDVHDGFNQMWAATLLRSLPLLVIERQSYLAMPHVQAVLDRGRYVAVNASAPFLLQEGSRPAALWQNARFSLTRSPEVFVRNVENPNGVETVDGHPFFWIGHSRESTLVIQAAHAGSFSLEAAAWWAGPSLPEHGRRTLVVQDSAGERNIELNFSSPHIVLHLAAGENRVRLHIAEAPSVAVQANGDQRELLLGMLGYFLKPLSLP